jgi:hypothetical protein
MHTSEIVDSVEMDRFWAEYAWLLAAKGDVSCALLHSGRNSTVLHTKLSACNHEIGCSLISGLCVQKWLGKTEQVESVVLDSAPV